MEADWEVEIGGGAPVIEALWPGFVDLRRSPERLVEIAEAVSFPALADLLLALNAASSPFWTAKCDLWKPAAEEKTLADPAGANGIAPATLACYVDLLPWEGLVFAQWKEAEALCREWVTRLAAVDIPNGRAELVIRQAIAGAGEGFGVTAYLSAAGPDHSSAAITLGAAMTALAGTVPVKVASKLQWNCVGE
jgi:hypothetical protein